MPPWLSVALVVVFLGSRPIEARLWRAGRLSDRAATLLLLGRMPAFVLTLCLLQGAPLLLTAGLVTLTTLPMLFFYRIFMNLLAEQRAEFEKEATRRKQA